MKLYIQPVVNVFQTNAYFFINEETKNGFLIDPGAEGERLLKIIADNDWTIEKVLLTHGHFDHSYQAAKVANTLGVSCVMNQNAVNFMKDDNLNLAVRYHQHVIWPKKVELIDKDQLISSQDGSFGLQAISMPGHTPDSQIFYSEKYNFALVGDTLYDNDVGLTIFPKGNESELVRSISQKLCSLPDETKLFNGHTVPMTVTQVKELLASDYGIII